jgi:crossover junction endodeoxyribonuclease RuvC
MRVLGIDPGLRRTGFGVVEVQGAALRYVASGVIAAPAGLALEQRLKLIHDHILEVIHAHAPSVAAVEKVFVNVNASSTLLLGQARGAALCALAGGELSVHEYTALQIKKSVVGAGHADKRQVQVMVRNLLGLDGLPPTDSADALACAICHAHVGPLAARLGAARSTGRGMRLRGRRLAL